MPNHSNVLAFEARAAHAHSPAPASLAPARLAPVEACRDRLVRTLTSLYAERLAQAQDEFLAQVDRSRNPEQQQRYLSAAHLLNRRGPELIDAFQRAYFGRFAEGIRRLTGQERDASQTADELALLDSDEFERDLALGKLSARATCNASQQLTALDRRLAALLNLPRISQDENPLHPRALFTSLLDALGAMEVEDQVALLILNAFERQTASGLNGAYAELNQFLVDKGVLPSLPVAELERPAPSGTAAAASGRIPGVPAGPASDAQAVDRPVPPSAATTAGSGEGTDVFAMLARALDLAGGNLLAGSVMANAGVPAAVPPVMGTVGPTAAGVHPAPWGVGPEAGATDSAVSSLAQWLQMLGSLQRGALPTGVLTESGQTHMHMAPAPAAAMNQIRAVPIASWAQPLEAITIDIVARLFDTIFEDPDLTAPLRAELARLQIPILKVALIDKGFFSDRQHPARALLDLIARAGIGLTETEEARLLREVRQAIDEVVEHFDTDLGVFDQQRERLQAFLQADEAQANARSQLLVAQMELADRKEAAAARVSDELAGRLKGHPLPPMVGDFLNRHWRLVLLDAFVRGGDQCADWQESTSAMDALIWSVAPKQDPAERARLLTELPALLKRLRRGIELVGQSDTWDALYGQLIRLHMGALSTEPAARVEGGTPSSVSAHAPGSEIRAVPRRTTTGAVGQATAPADPDAATGEDRFIELAKALEVGAWVELEGLHGTRKTLRLSWVSEFRGAFLFTDRRGENSLTLAVTSLADHFRKGTARVLSRDPLTERAVATLLNQVTSAPAAATSVLP